MTSSVSRTLTIPALVLMLAAPLGAADHGCNGTITTVDLVGTTMYVDDRSERLGDINHWIYLESNGVEGLQSGGVLYLDPFGYCWEPIPCFPDPCYHLDPDRMLF